MYQKTIENNTFFIALARLCSQEISVLVARPDLVVKVRVKIPGILLNARSEMPVDEAETGALKAEGHSHCPLVAWQ